MADVTVTCPADCGRLLSDGGCFPNEECYHWYNGDRASERVFATPACRSNKACLHPASPPVSEGTRPPPPTCTCAATLAFHNHCPVHCTSIRVPAGGAPAPGGMPGEGMTLTFAQAMALVLESFPGPMEWRRNNGEPWQDFQMNRDIGATPLDLFKGEFRRKPVTGRILVKARARRELGGTVFSYDHLVAFTEECVREVLDRFDELAETQGLNNFLTKLRVEYLGASQPKEGSR